MAGFMKLRDPQAFTVVIDAFGLVPDYVSENLAIVLPILEIIAGLGLIFDFPMSLHTVSGLLIIFIAILIYGINLGLDIDCGCYGPEDIESRAFGGLRLALYRDLAMATGVLLLYIRRVYKTLLNKTIFNLEHHEEQLCEQKEP
jgi:uncharacterized membrane protein YphA (DoxX/SURF4 family)